MRSIAIMNQKGGVGKTTTSVNLGAALARAGKKVLIMDLDPQAHATLHLGVEPEPGFKSIYDVMVEGCELREVRRAVSDNLWLVPSHLDLAAAEMQLVGAIGRDFILRDKLAADDMEFDYILLDCPPSLGILTINALIAVQEIFIPLQPHYLALQGLGKLLETIQIVTRLNSALHLTGVILCLFETTTLAKEVAGDAELFFEQARGQNLPWSDAIVFETRIRRNVRLAESPSYGQSIFAYDNSSRGAEDYLALAKEVLAQEK